MPWEAIQYVGGALTLIAFLAATVAWILRTKILERERIIASAPASQRAEVVRNTLEFFDVDTRYLAPDAQYNVAIEQIRARATRFYISALVVALFMILSAALTVIAIIWTPSDQRPLTPKVAPIPKPIGWWTGDGTAADESGSNNGTMVGEVSFAPGLHGQAFNFAGKNSYVEMPTYGFPTGRKR